MSTSRRYAWGSLFTLACILLHHSASARPHNISVSLPDGTSNHGDPNLLCLPSSWSDMALFFLLNYFAHAATVRPRPGERLGSTVLNAALALIYPYSGLERGIQGILRRTIFIKDELEQAAAEEALCIVIRSQEWRPWGGEALQVTRGIPTRENNAPEHQGLSFPMGESRTEIADGAAGSTSVSVRIGEPNWFISEVHDPLLMEGSRIVHGLHKLPEGYQLAVLPSRAKVVHDGNDRPDRIRLSSSYNALKVVVAVFQSCSSVVTLYRTRGDQIDRYGFAAFGLTVLPYTIMSTVNLFGSLLTPAYPTLYLVRSPEMNEAEARGGLFDGVIGRVEPGAGGDRQISVAFRIEEEETGVQIGTEERVYTVQIGTEERVYTVQGFGAPEAEADITIQAYAYLRFKAYLEDLRIGTFGLLYRRPSEAEASFAVSLACLLMKEAPQWIREGPQLIKEGLRQVKEDLQRIKEDLQRIFRPLIFRPLPEPEADIIVPACSARDACDLWNKTSREALWIRAVGLFFFCPLPYVTILALTHFRPASSTLTQRVWLMFWLALGVFAGLFIPDNRARINGDRDARTRRSMAYNNYERYFRNISFAVYAVVAIGGMVTVGQMIRGYGTCIQM